MFPATGLDKFRRLGRGTPPLESNSSAATAKKLDGLGDNDLYCADQLVPRVFRQ